MTCFYCEGDMIDSTTTYVEDFGNCIVIIRNVPCSKCSQCGEVSYNGTVLKQIEKIVDDAYCQKLYDNCKSNPDNSNDNISLEDFAKELRIEL